MEIVRGSLYSAGAARPAASMPRLVSLIAADVVGIVRDSESV